MNFSIIKILFIDKRLYEINKLLIMVFPSFISSVRLLNFFFKKFDFIIISFLYFDYKVMQIMN